MPRGKKKSHKGGHRHFTSEDDLALEVEKARKQKEWRAKKGIESDEEEDEESKEKGTAKATEPGQLPSDNSEEEEEEEEETEENKPKGVSHLIEIENPNRVKQKTKKVTSVVVDGAASAAEPALSRKEREELEKQLAKERYQKMHLAGKTEEARADLARLALIKKQREDAARKREEERKAAEEAKVAAEQRLLDKKQKAGTGEKN